jgi:hypothetical protein
MRITILLIIVFLALSCKTESKENTSKEVLSGISNVLEKRKFSIANGNIKDSIVEHLTMDGIEFANQIWLVNQSNDTVGGNYYIPFIKDTTILGEVTRLRFTLFEPSISYNSDMYVLVPIEDDKLKKDFSNLFEIELDTFPSLKNDGIPHPELSNLDWPLNHIAEFGFKYSTVGKKRVRGVIVERGKLDDKGYERRLYFDKSFYISE